MNFLLALPLVLFLTGCTTLVDEEPMLKPLSPSAILGLFQADQRARVALPMWWQSLAILDVDQEGQGRRHRVTIVGEGKRLARLRIYGPFQKVVMELLVSPDWLHLVDPDKQRVLEVPADAQGMKQLAGFSLDPKDLYSTLIGQVGDFAAVTPDSRGQKTVIEPSGDVWLVMAPGQRLRLDPQRGLVVQRMAKRPGQVEFSAQYRWPNAQSGLVAGGNHLLLPERLVLSLAGGSTRLTFVFKEWQFFKNKPPGMPNWTEPPPFPVMRPDAGEAQKYWGSEDDAEDSLTK